MQNIHIWEDNRYDTERMFMKEEVHSNPSKKIWKKDRTNTERIHDLLSTHSAL